jgi:hypothetical protein
MQTVQLKYDIISWVTGLNDRKLINKLHQWTVAQDAVEMPVKGMFPPKRNGSLTEGYGFWSDSTPPYNETNYRDQLWQTGRNVW